MRGGHRNMYYATGLPGWMRFGYSPGRGRLPPRAQYLMTGAWPSAYLPPMPATMPVPPAYPVPAGMPAMPAQPGIPVLESQAAMLEQQLEQIKKRLEELKK